jgi:regulator of sigma E protease
MHGQQVTLTVDRLMPGQTASKGDIFDVTLVPGSDIAPSPREGYVRVVGVAKESPGDMAGLLPGDLIVGFNGESITGAQDPVADLQHLTAAHAGEKVTVSLLRKDQKLDLSLVPRANPPEGEGRMGIMIGVEYKNVATGLMYAEGPQQQMLIPQPLGASLQYGVERSLSVFSTLAEIPSRILSRNITPEEARPVSIVGISQWGGQVLQESIQDNTPITILNYIAMINILLGITNLLPIPALDGGRIVFVLVEMVRGRPVTPEREGLVHLIGLAFLLALGMIVILNDIINPVPSIIR